MVTVTFVPLRGPFSCIHSDISVSLLVVIVSFCTLALLTVSIFVSWKLCWLPWRHQKNKASAVNTTKTSQLPLQHQQQLEQWQQHQNQHREWERQEQWQSVPATPEASLNSMTSALPLENRKALEQAKNRRVEMVRQDDTEASSQALKISHTSPDIPAALEHDTVGHARPPEVARIHRQTTEPTSSARHDSFRRHMPRQLNVSPLEPGSPSWRTSPNIGHFKPELYKQCSVESGKDEAIETCGKLNFSLRYDFQMEQLFVRIVQALDLPIKDFSGSSDPYVKLYLLPDRKRKFQTKVHRKTLNPVFEETFSFTVPHAHLHSHALHFSIFDFDRFTRHDMIGQVVVHNLGEAVEMSSVDGLWRDVECVLEEKDDLGEIMFSLCYLPTAGRLTLTVIKGRNLKAMDITGASDPYVKVSLICEGRRLKKKKTSTKRNTLNPVYNEAIVFDVPPESVEQVSLLVAVVDYDRVGYNETIGVCRAGNGVERLGREHWNEMLAYPRKPITRWHSLQEWERRTASFDSHNSYPSL
uniref:synaptotagmin-10-like n=1 Tax=Myxine glutinosa TaxID=7769 RepID=UPI00358F0B33